MTLDGNGKTITATETIANGGFIQAESNANNVTIKNLTVNTNGKAKHGIQFYCVTGGKVDNVTVNGGSYTSIIVNGSEVKISDSVLNPDKDAYANIEYAMGNGVTTLPEIALSNVTGSPEKPLVYADEATLIRANNETPGEATMNAEKAAEVAEKINANLQGATISYVITGSAPVPGTMFYTITFNANGGTVTPTSAVTNEAGLLSDLPTPKRSGSYAFKGWYTAASGGTKVTESTEFKENTTIYAQWEYTGVIYVPTTPTVQKPAIEADSNATVTLDSTGTTATITVADGYELADVTVNGVSKGAVTTLTGLKTGDKVVVTTKKTEEPPVVDDSARIKAGVQATTLKIYSKSLNTKGSGKGWIQVRWVKSKGFKVDGYELYRGKTKSTMKRYDTTTKTTYTNKNYLKKGNRYYYKVRGYRMINGEKVYTQWSKTIYRLAK